MMQSRSGQVKQLALYGQRLFLTLLRDIACPPAVSCVLIDAKSERVGQYLNSHILAANSFAALKAAYRVCRYAR